MKRNLKKIPTETFVRAYIAHKSNREVAIELGVSEDVVAARASRLRSRGIHLPYRYEMVKYTKSFVDEMNELIGDIG